MREDTNLPAIGNKNFQDLVRRVALIVIGFKGDRVISFAQPTDGELHCSFYKGAVECFVVFIQRDFSPLIYPNGDIFSFLQTIDMDTAWILQEGRNPCMGGGYGIVFIRRV